MKLLHILSVALLTLLETASLNAQFAFVTNNGAITITGYLGTDGSVVIPGSINGYPVTSIGSSAFLNQSTVTNVSIPGSVTNIALQAFTGSGLTSINIPDSVVNIGQSAFLNCSSLAGLTIGNAVKTIGYDAFYGCSSLTNVFIPRNVSNIYSSAFTYCTNLMAFEVDALNPAFSSVAGVLLDKEQTTLLCYPAGLPGDYVMPGSVCSIGDFAFAFCYNFTNVIVPNNVTNIEQYAFYGCENATSFTLSSNLVSIGQYAFSACADLAGIVIPTNVVTIGESAFSSTALTSVLIPASVTNIGAGAFGYCFNLTSLNVASGSLAFSSVEGVLFNSNHTTVVEFPVGKSGSFFRPGSYSIPLSVTCIGEAAFQSCLFSNVTIPAGLTNIGRTAFSGCSRLTSLVIPDGVTFIGYGAFESTAITTLTIPSSVTTCETFGYWSKLRGIYFLGNAPSSGSDHHAIALLNGATIYYLPGSTGWGPTFSGVPTALWLPTLQNSRIGGQGNQFGFSISWASGQTVVVEACTNLSQPVWLALQTNTLATNATIFNDAQWINYPRRFYRVRQQ